MESWQYFRNRWHTLVHMTTNTQKHEHTHKSIENCFSIPVDNEINVRRDQNVNRHYMSNLVNVQRSYYIIIISEKLSASLMGAKKISTC